MQQNIPGGQPKYCMLEPPGFDCFYENLIGHLANLF